MFCATISMLDYDISIIYITCFKITKRNCSWSLSITAKTLISLQRPLYYDILYLIINIYYPWTTNNNTTIGAHYTVVFAQHVMYYAAAQ